MNSVAIVGGGIGGLTLANLLAGAGWSVDVFERSPRLPAQGSALGMWPDAMAVFSTVGVADAIRQAGHPQGAAEVRDAGGDLLSRIPARGETVMVSRSALLEVLYAAHPNVSFSAEIDDVRKLDYDIVVGSDGVNSVARSYVANKTVAAADLGVSVIIGQFAGASEMFTEYWGPGKSFGITPLSSNRRDWHAAYRSPRSGSSEAILEQANPLGFVEEQYASWNDEIAAAVDATRANSVMRYHVRTTPKLRTWHRDNVVLIGDAAHAMAPNLGRGACETVIDAAALAQALGPCDERTDPSQRRAAFREYERNRRSTAYRIAFASRVMCRLGMLDRGAKLRNLAMKCAP